MTTNVHAVEGPTTPARAGTGGRLSVVLATFNGASYLAEQLASLEAQTRLPDEVVVVDDGSRDATPDLLRAFAARSPFPVELVLRDHHRGTWRTFEEGLAHATGDILLVCDQDDRWLPHKLEVLAARLDEDPDAFMAFSDAHLVDSHGEQIGASRWRVAGFSPERARAVAHDALGEIFSRQAVSGCTLAVRATLLPALLPFPIDIHPGLPVMMYDRWIALVAASAGPVLAVPEPLIDYRIHPGQQIGIPALALRRLAPRSALQASQFLHGQPETRRRMAYHLAHFEQIEERLEAAGLTSAAVDARVAGAERHLRMRSGLGARRRSRVRPIAREYLRRDGYRRFSLGLSSAVADVLR